MQSKYDHLYKEHVKLQERHARQTEYLKQLKDLYNKQRELTQALATKLKARDETARAAAAPQTPAAEVCVCVALM